MAIEKKQWLDSETFSDGVPLCQTLPCTTAMQTTAYVGLKTGDVIGAATSFIGFSLPTFLVLLLHRPAYHWYANDPALDGRFGEHVIIVQCQDKRIGFSRSGWTSGALAYQQEVNRQPIQGENWVSIGLRLVTLDKLDDNLKRWTK
jgi:hypothetical protein